MNPVIYDIAGIGIGPFNLGLAALLNEIPSLNVVFFEQRDKFEWHPGMMIEHATVQVPFYADLVTLASPSSPFNFMSFLQHKKRMFRFGIRENYYITRKEYNQYCNWVAARLPDLHFGEKVSAVLYNGQLNCYEIIIKGKNGLPRNIFAAHIVIGTGSEPYLPSFITTSGNPSVFHSSDYLIKKPMLLGKKDITIAGSGQSAAEIMYDLLPHHKLFTGGLNWFSRSQRIYPMDFSKFALEMASPDYIDYFFNLAQGKKKKVLQQQDTLYKGINASLISTIYDSLYDLSLDNSLLNIGIFPNAELTGISEISGDSLQLHFKQPEQEITFSHRTEALILATGYRQYVPSFLESVRERIQWMDGGYDVNRNYSIDKNGNEIFVQNAELHTHGFNAPDLSLGPYRNACIINAILGREHFVPEKHITFQHFGFR